MSHGAKHQDVPGGALIQRVGEVALPMVGADRDLDDPRWRRSEVLLEPLRRRGGEDDQPVGAENRRCEGLRPRSPVAGNSETARVWARAVAGGQPGIAR